MDELDLADGAASPPRALTVTELTRAVRSALEGAIGEVTVEGEIGSYRRQASGHQYFTLKDERCQVSCVLFQRPYQKALRQIPLEEGMQVQVRGMLTVYEARGQYQINVSSVQAAGVGLLQAKFEALKRKLGAEGLFDPERKKPLPRFPRTVGIVTSPTGAAIRDMLNILQRRAPWIRIVVNPARVQGDGAGAEIADAVREFNAWAESGFLRPDVLIVTRGGGSVEDLWQFNDETLARAIADSAIPVVSAVGHEIDFTISDFVADLRAPTPSAAAELVAPDAAELRQRLFQIEAQLRRRALAGVERWKGRLGFVGRSVLFREPARALAELSQRLDLAMDGLRRAAEQRLAEERQRTDALLAVVRQHRPDQLLALRRHQVHAAIAGLAARARDRIRREKSRLDRLRGLLDVLSPLATLERGYTVTTDMEGNLVASVGDVTPNMVLRTRLRDGSVESRVV